MDLTQNLKEAINLIFGENPELRQIIGVTLQMSFLSTFISLLIGIPCGLMLGSGNFKGKGIILRITGTLMGLPPVVAGLIIFMILSRSGPLGSFKLLYTVSAMVIVQVLLITPIITGLSAAVISIPAESIKETTAGLGFSPFKQRLYMVYECKAALLSVGLSGFGRAIAEVGAVQLVGGNIQYKTRVMTTAIMMETNMGNFSFAIALGIVLLAIAFIVNIIARSLEEGFQAKRSIKSKGES